MKLKMNREHYQNPDAAPSGLLWVPKQGFDSEEEAREQGFLTSKRQLYTCTFCSKLHIAKKWKEVTSDQ